MTSINLFENKEKITCFYDAEFPGNFVKGSLNFFSKFKNLSFDWLASSLVPCDENTALDDVYGIYKNEPHKWLMNDKINGDVTDFDTFEYHLNFIKNYTNNAGIDIYFCDLGLQHNNENFHIQEKINIIPQTCAVLKGMSILKKNGSLLIKIFSCLEDDTRKLVAMILENFTQVYMCKPSSSRGRNKELYLIATGYTQSIPLEKIFNFFLQKKSIFNEVNNFYLTASFASQFFTSRQLSWLEKMSSSPLETNEKIYQKYAEDYLDFLQLSF